MATTWKVCVQKIVDVLKLYTKSIEILKKIKYKHTTGMRWHDTQQQSPTKQHTYQRIGAFHLSLVGNWFVS